jgi:predicted HAD superfamily hydrolase
VAAKAKSKDAESVIAAFLKSSKSNFIKNHLPKSQELD